MRVLAKRMADGIYKQKHKLSDLSKEEIANIKLGKRWIDWFLKRHTELPAGWIEYGWIV